MSALKASEYDLPGKLRNAVAGTLDAYNQPTGGPGRDELETAVARIDIKFRDDIHTRDHSAPISCDDDLLVYSVPREEWEDLCDAVKVYAKARRWAQRIQLRAARRTTERDPYVALEHARGKWIADDRRAVVVQHP